MNRSQKLFDVIFIVDYLYKLQELKESCDLSNLIFLIYVNALIDDDNSKDTVLNGDCVLKIEGSKFTSKELDDETGLYYFGARYYDAQTSRWASADPIYDGIEDGYGGYTYCKNNPIKYTDPNGQYAQIIVPGVGLVLYIVGNMILHQRDQINNKVNMSNIKYYNQGRDQNPHSLILQTDLSIGYRTYDIDRKEDDVNVTDRYACFFRSLQAAAEIHANKSLTADQINNSRSDLMSRFNSDGDFTVLSDNFFVKNPNEIVRNALTSLGSNLTATTYDKDHKPSSYDYVARQYEFIAGRKEDGTPKYSGHWVLEDKKGNIIYNGDPTIPLERKTDNVRYIKIHKKD